MSNFSCIVFYFTKYVPFVLSHINVFYLLIVGKRLKFGVFVKWIPHVEGAYISNLISYVGNMVG